MKSASLVSLATALLLSATPGSAAEIRLWMSSATAPLGYHVGGSVDPAGANNKRWEWNVTHGDLGSLTVRAFGYRSANDNGSGPFTQFNVERYNGGLGVCDDNGCGAPQHAVDNDGRNDAIVIDFGAGRRFAGVGFSIGWEQYAGCTATRADASCPDIEAWVGDSFTTANGFAGWTRILAGDPDNNIQPNREHAFTSAAQGRYLAIAPQAGSERCVSFGQNGTCRSWEHDYFKLQSLVVRSARQVPEPGSIALLAAGLGMVLASRRRRTPGARA